jgi:hypothetical protein
MTLCLPRYVIAKQLASGATGFYFTVPTRYQKMGCTIGNEPLGTDYTIACGADGNGGRAAALNALFDEWWKIKNGQPVESVARYGTVDWLFREYKSSKRYRERVSERTREDYELLMQIVIDLPTKRGDRVAQRPVKSSRLSPLTKSMNRSASAQTGRGLARAKRSWRYAGLHGASSTVCILIALIAPYRTPGMA